MLEKISQSHHKICFPPLLLAYYATVYKGDFTWNRKEDVHIEGREGVEEEVMYGLPVENEVDDDLLYSFKIIKRLYTSAINMM